ncbi:MAG: DUF177 domain-containing protein [Duncaniella sp.]|nr:DUF177 domain-containing protein [Duncaniella sp.]
MGKFSAFNLPLKTLPEGVSEFTYHLDKQFFKNMENSDIHDANLETLLTVTHRNDLYTLSMHVTGDVTLICDRCLDNLVFPIDTTYDIAVKYGDDYDETDELLVIPYSDNSLNVSYMIHDTVSLAIPIKHVHPLGKCNRAMSALLRKHRATKPDDEDDPLTSQLIDEMDDMDTAPDIPGGSSEQAPVDPRWNDLKKFSSNPDSES